jgi:hypothetical protein
MDVTPEETLAIDSILNDTERQCAAYGSLTRDLEAIDEQCRSIWSDWDFAVPGSRRSPKRSPHPAINRAAIERPHSASKAIRSSSDDNELPRATIQPDDEALMRQRSRRLKQTVAPEVKSREQIGKKMAPIQPFTRVDAVRLRQDNIKLKAQVAKLKAALDRTQLENSRLQAELHKVETEKIKQKSIIAYLKDAKLYGKR